MVKQKAELSSDLEWMLLSGQAPPELVAEALVQQHYRPLYCLALSVIKDERLARQAVSEALIEALVQAHRYKGKTAAATWLYQLAVQVFSRFEKAGQGKGRETDQAEAGERRNDGPEGKRAGSGAVWAAHWPANRPAYRPASRQDDRQAGDERRLSEELEALEPATRLGACLTLGLDWELPQAAAVLGLAEAELKGRLETARPGVSEAARQDRLARERRERPSWQSAASPQAGAGQPAEGKPEDPAELLGEAMHFYLDGLSGTPRNLEGVIEEVLTQARARQRRQRRVFSWKEIAWAGLLSLLAVGALWTLNRSLPDPPTGGRSPANLQVATPAATAAATPQVQTTFIYLVLPGDTLAAIAARVGTGERELAKLNQLDLEVALSPGQRLQIAFNDPPWQRPAATLPAPRPGRTQLLAATASQAELRDFLQNNAGRWQSLWLEASSVVYPAAAYTGPPQTLRRQGWADNPDRQLEISSQDGRPYLQRQLRLGGLIFNLVPNFPTILVQAARPESSHSWLDELIRPAESAWFNGAGDLQALTDQWMIGRPVVQAVWKRNPQELEDGQPRRISLWIDAQTGLLLRIRTYAKADGPVILSDTMVEKIDFNPQLDRPDPYQPEAARQQDFIPGPERSARDRFEAGGPPGWAHSYGHDPLALLTPPAWLDPSREALTFQFSATGNVSSSAVQGQAAQQMQAALFAGGYYLGSLPMPNPWGLQCDRSPDGGRIAFVRAGRGYFNAGSQDQPGFGWVALSNLQDLHSPKFEISPTALAFAPDGHHLAVAGRKGNSSSSIDLLDLDSGQVTELVNGLPGVVSMAYSSDGKLIGLVARSRQWFTTQALILKADDGQTVSERGLYSAPFPQGSGWAGSDTPAAEWQGWSWGVPYPNPNQGLDRCAAAPASS